LAVPIPLVFAKVNAHLEERRQGKLHYCSACGAASRAERYCDQCGALIVLVDAIAELDAEAKEAQQGFDWLIQVGSAELTISIQYNAVLHDTTLAVSSAILRVHLQNTLAFYRRCLELNLILVGCSIGRPWCGCCSMWPVRLISSTTNWPALSGEALELGLQQLALVFHGQRLQMGPSLALQIGIDLIQRHALGHPHAQHQGQGVENTDLVVLPALVVGGESHQLFARHLARLHPRP
jgi:hypothetical protein